MIWVTGFMLGTGSTLMIATLLHICSQLAVVENQVSLSFSPFSCHRSSPEWFRQPKANSFDLILLLMNVTC